MAPEIKTVVIVATPTSSLLPHLLHALAHQKSISAHLITRKTSISFPFVNDNYSEHVHAHSTTIRHHTTDFQLSTLTNLLQELNPETIICHLPGSDLHQTPTIIQAAKAANVKLFIPSEFAFDTSNPSVRKLLPPYETRNEIQQLLKQSGLNFRAIYAGVALEESLKVDGVIGVDCVWGSVTTYAHDGTQKVPFSTNEDVAKMIMEVIMAEDCEEGNEIWMSSFMVTLDELVERVEECLGRRIDRFEGDLEDARREARERIERGYFDGGVALMGRLAMWDEKMDSWKRWTKSRGRSQDVWKETVMGVMNKILAGKLGGSGCGC